MALMNRHRFEKLVDQVLESLPEWVVERLDNLVVVVEEMPTTDQDPDGDLLGIYEGTSLPDRSADYWGALPDQITIFRQPHIRLGLPPKDIEEEIKRTILHEIGHYLGFDEDRLHQLGWD